MIAALALVAGVAAAAAPVGALPQRVHAHVAADPETIGQSSRPFLDPPCYESGTISVDTTWDATCIHVLSSSVIIANGVTLTVSPGVIVKLWTGNGEIIVDNAGSLVAHGTSSQPILFTSLRDDVGGDTNGDGPSQGQPGDWNSILAAGNSLSLDYVIVRYGGASTGCSHCGNGGMITNEEVGPSYWGSTIAIDHSQIASSATDGIHLVNAPTNLSLTNSTIDNNASIGVDADSNFSNVLSVTDSTLSGNGADGMLIGNAATVTVTRDAFAGNGSDGLQSHEAPISLSNSTFTSNGGWAANYLGASAPGGTLFSGLSASGNGHNAIHFANGVTFSASATLSFNSSLPVYAIEGGAVEIPNGVTLTVSPGVIVKLWAGNGEIIVDGGGSLVAHGTSSQPILFTSLRDDVGGDTNGDGPSQGQPGDWNSILAAGNTLSLDYVIVRYGGASTGCSHCGNGGMITNEEVGPSWWNSTVTIDHSQITSSATDGIHLVNKPTSLSVTDSTIENNAGYGVHAGTQAQYASAPSNFWNASSGPRSDGLICYDSNNQPFINPAPGSGDMVSCYVDYSDWLGSDPIPPTPTPTQTFTPTPTPTPTDTPTPSYTPTATDTSTSTPTPTDTPTPCPGVCPTSTSTATVMPVSVGGVAAQPDVAALSPPAPTANGRGMAAYALSAAALAMVAALGVWYVRRRRAT